MLCVSMRQRPNGCSKDVLVQVSGISGAPGAKTPLQNLIVQLSYKYVTSDQI